MTMLIPHSNVNIYLEKQLYVKNVLQINVKYINFKALYLYLCETVFYNLKAREMRKSIAIIAILLYAFAEVNAYAEKDCSYESTSIQVDCPEDEYIYMCEPSAVPPPMNEADFYGSDSSNEMTFNVVSTTSQYSQFKKTTYEYSFTDADGNISNCWQHYYIPDHTIEKPEITESLNICQNAQWTLIDKPYEDNYYFYADNRGEVGDFMSSCENTDVWCLADNLNINTSKTGTHNFWVKKVVKESSTSETDQGYWCESDAVLLTIKVSAKPSAVLKESTMAMEMGDFMNLMSMVEDNHTGVWKGKDILGFKSITGQQFFYYFPRKTGLNKIYYTVSNGTCKKTYTLTTEVLSPRKIADSMLEDLIVFPNPSSDKVFVNLSNSIDESHTISVFDISGKRHINMVADDVRNTIFELDVNQLLKGVYIVEMRNSIMSSSKKLIVE